MAYTNPQQIQNVMTLVDEAAVRRRGTHPQMISQAAELKAAVEKIEHIEGIEKMPSAPLFLALLADPALAKKLGAVPVPYPMDEDLFQEALRRGTEGKKDKPPLIMQNFGDKIYIITFEDGPNLVRDTFVTIAKQMRSVMQI